MLDFVGTILMAVLAVVLVSVLAQSAAPRGVVRTRLGVALSAWFLLAAALGATGAFRSPALPVGIAVGLAVFLPVLVASRPLARAQAFGIPLATLVAVHAGRLVGVLFLVLYNAGRLPWTFAHSAGWGDIAVGATALPVAWAVHRRVPGWGWIAGIWNAVGLADLLAAVTLGVGSAPGALVRFIHETPGSGAITSFPWVMIPAYFVPLFILGHIAIYARLAAERHAHVEGQRPASLEAA